MKLTGTRYRCLWKGANEARREARCAPEARVAEEGGSNAAKVYVPMRDFISDWKKWSLAERVLAIVVVLGMAGLPIGLALASTGGA
jgi:hypothetical protein